MTRRLIAALIVVGLGIGVWALWPRSETEVPTTTTPIAAAPTTTIATFDRPTSTTTDTGTTTAVTAGSHGVETVEEAEAILRELWFGWFEGIYNQDEDRIREVVASQTLLDAARDAFGTEFKEEPQKGGIKFGSMEVMQADSTCTVLWGEVSIDFRNGSSESLFVLRWNDGWRLMSVWARRGDIWQDDCISQLESLS